MGKPRVYSYVVNADSIYHRQLNREDTDSV